ncbi:MAG: Radical domain protein [Flaviaesturariibacter sp.]|nr:Radical domain protein [Flaviaesturariibacter sp.]
MYKITDYINRGGRFLNNQLRPGHKKLSTLMIYATDLCDSACKHCLIWAKRPVNFLPFETIKAIMQSDCITKDTSIGLEGGEFMLHPEALEILEWFTVHHKNFDLLSNCLKPESLIEAVKKFPPRHLYISLDGTAETYLYMRGKAGYDSVIKVVEALKDLLPISVMFTLSPYNDFNDLQHVAEVCKKYTIDLRIGIYNDIAFFDTLDEAHSNNIGSLKNDTALTYKDVKEIRKDKVSAEPHIVPTLTMESKFGKGLKSSIPEIVKSFNENYDFIVLYDEWRKGALKMRCYSILDSLVILPNGDVPICQSLDLKIGNVFEQSLDIIFNGKETQNLHDHYVHNCNQCWLNFHRKYDVILYRTFEKYFGKNITSRLFGYYQWEETALKSYKQVLAKQD